MIDTFWFAFPADDVGADDSGHEEADRRVLDTMLTSRSFLS
jgi:hypothetical protein